ncbi:polysaccharide pyruvyl transferase family protein [Ochrovirga pacifica]|uniref:polysaccharide pyruvyl transferase family protein n=1 Tax=Ochrovirga pacifica TaxID=1042376 RepID=UPI0002559E04|nr:polysaccharide pyruvyl transferase family protein [Ochrovirga pacifica]
MSPLLDTIKRKLWIACVGRLRNTQLDHWLYKSYWHYKFSVKNSKNEGQAYYTAIPNPDAGFGHQMANWIAGVWFSQQFKLKYAYSPFTNSNWNVFLGFDEGEIGGDVFSVNVKSKKSSDSIEDRIFPTVTSWIRGFVDAKFAIVDSFHGCVFAIIFNKPFIAFGNKERGLTRFTSLLKLFKLEDRLILNSDDLTVEVMNATIDWKIVNRILKENKTVSEEYLNML